MKTCCVHLRYAEGGRDSVVYLQYRLDLTVVSQAIDMDNKGFINANDLRAVIEKLSEGWSDEEVRRAPSAFRLD